MAAPRPAAGGAPVPAEAGGFFANPTVRTMAKSLAIFFGIQILLGPNSPFKSAAPTFTPPSDASPAVAATPGYGATPAASPGMNASPAAPKLDLVSLWPASTLLVREIGRAHV